MEDWGSAKFPVSIMSLFQRDVTSCCSGQAHQQGKNDRTTHITVIQTIFATVLSVGSVNAQAMIAEKKTIYSLHSCQSFQSQLGISVYPFLYAEVNAKRKKISFF